MSAEEKSLGGSPTPNTDDTAKRAAGSTLPPHSELVRNGWKLVRHCPVGDRWHSAADHLRGTEVYGDPSGVDRPDAPEWSVRFDNEPFDEFLFATGDGVKWMIVNKGEIEPAPPNLHGQVPPTKLCAVVASSRYAALHKVRIKHRAQTPSEPFLSLTDHDIALARSNDMAGFLYVGAGFSAEDFGTPNELLTVNAHGGANVYVRQHVKAKLAPCLNALAGSLADEVVLSPDGLNVIGSPAKGMQKLWARAPQAVLAGVVHPFYRHQTVDWLGQEITSDISEGAEASGTEKLAIAAGCECRDSTWSGVNGCRGGDGQHPWHAHPLEMVKRGTGWSCDGRKVKGGCRGDGGGGKQARYRCTDGCDYDLCQPCVDSGAFQSRLDAISSLDEGGPGVPVPPHVHAVRALLMGIFLRGLVLGPLRSALAPVREVGDASAISGGRNFKWCAAAKVPDGRLFFLPPNTTRASQSNGVVSVPKPGAEDQARRAGNNTTSLTKSPLQPTAVFQECFQVLVFDPHLGRSTIQEYPLPLGFSKLGYNSAVVGSDGCVYGIPANGDRVLKIDPKLGVTSQALTFIGPTFSGDWKWGEGILASDGNIYCAPCCADQVLCIDPASGVVSKMGPVFKGRDKWWGAAWVPSRAEFDFQIGDAVLVDVTTQESKGGYGWKNGTVIAVIPADVATDASPATNSQGDRGSKVTNLQNAQASVTYKIKCQRYFSQTNRQWYEPEVEVSGKQVKALPDVTTYKSWSTSATGTVYFTPQNDAAVLKFDPQQPNDAKVVGNLVGGASLPEGGEKFHGACRTAGGFVVCAPAHRGGRKALVFDPDTEELLYCGPDQGGEAYKWHDTVCGADGTAYGIPHNAPDVLAIDGSLASQSAHNLAAALAEKEELGADADASKNADVRHKITDAEENGVVQRLQPATDKNLSQVLGMAGSSANVARYGCGVLADDGFVYAAPFMANKILRIDTDSRYGVRGTKSSGAQKTAAEAKDDQEGSILWLWRNQPELWFQALVHPTYGSEFLAWFATNSRDDNDDLDLAFDDEKQDQYNGNRNEADESAHELPLVKQCGIGLRKDDLAAQAGTAGSTDQSNSAATGAGGGLMGTGSVLRPGEGLFMRAARRAAAVPELMGALLDITDPLVRRRLLSSPFLRKVLPRSKTVGPWILERLADPSRRTSVVDYFDVVSKLPDCTLLALPWANLNKDYGAGAGADSELAGGVRVAEGWGWTYWERFDLSLSWKEYQAHVEDKRRGELFTLAEARELLRHQVLCPGEDFWVAVVPGDASEQLVNYAKHKHENEDEHSETAPTSGEQASEVGAWSGTTTEGAKRRASASNWTAGISNFQDEEEIPMDWVQVGDLLHPPGTSHLQDLGRLPTWGTKPERTRPGVALWKPMGTVRNSLLIEAILDVDDASLRKSIMQTKLLQLMLRRTETVGPWIVARMSKSATCGPVVDYLLKASQYDAVDSDMALTEAFAAVPNLLPNMLKLPGALQERAVTAELVAKVLDSKLADRPTAIAVVAMDLLAIFLLLILYLDAVSKRSDLREGPPTAKLAIVSVVNCYFLVREAFQIYTMQELGLSWEYWSDFWNINDLAGSLLVFVVVGMAGSSDVATRLSPNFRGLSALASIFLWLKFLSGIKVLNIKLATFVYSLNMILHDLKEFMLVLLVVLGMFSIMFFILHADDTDAIDDGDQMDWDLNDARPFHSPFFSFLSVYQMIFGEFQVSWYEAESKGLTACSVALFVIFMFFVVVVMLNVLIAIVSDSYDFALTRAEKLFLRARLVLVAELDALGLTKPDFILFGKNKWSNEGNQGTWSCLGSAQVIGSIFRLHSKDAHRDGGKASVGTEWTGRVLHMEKSTEAIVTEHVEKGVGTVIDYLTTQAQRLKALEDKLNRQAFDQEKRDTALKEKELQAAHKERIKESNDRMDRMTFERKVVDAIKEATAKALAGKM